MENNWRFYVYLAFFLALGLLCQGLRFLLPMLPPPVELFLVGTLVNTVLVMAVAVTHRPAASVIGLVLPITAFFQGHLAILPMVPVVGLGNMVFAWLAGRFLERRRVWAVPFLKGALLYGGALLVIRLLALPDRAAGLLAFMMGWPQLVTGALGILLARVLLRRLAFFQKNSF